MLDYVLQAAGFFLQTAPIVPLMYAPFVDESLKYRRGRIVSVLVSALALFSVCFAVMEYLVVDSDNIKIIANSYMAAVVIVIAFAFFSVVRAHFICRALVFMIIVHYAAILFTAENTILPLLSHEDFYLSYSFPDVMLILVVTFLTLPFVYAFMRRVVSPALRFSDSKSMRRGFIYVTSALVLYCAAVMLFDYSFSRSSYGNAAVALFFTTLAVTDGILYYMFFYETKLVIENYRLSNRIQSFDEQYRQISRVIDESRRVRHDMRHHLNAISEMNKRGEYKELSEYLDAYTDAYMELEDFPICGYHAVDNILRYYIGLAREKEIGVTTELHSLSPDMEFDVTDITVLMGNLMENAIEACGRLSGVEEKLIKVWIKQTDASLLIRIENSCRSDLESRSSFSNDENFISTKHSKHDGQGLKSIRMAAEKYGGSAEFKRENGLFTARIVLNIP